MKRKEHNTNVNFKLKNDQKKREDDESMTKKLYRIMML